MFVAGANGGPRGGHAALTEAGRKALAAYRALEQQIMDNAVGERLEELSGMLRDTAR